MLLAGFFGLFFGCSEKDNDGGKESIKVPEPAQLEQVVSSNETNGNSTVRFSTTGPWSSSIEEVTKANDVASWVSISPDRGSAAGDYEISISLLPNTTTETRKARIKIICDATVITINIEQKGINEPVAGERRIRELRMIDPDNEKEITQIEYDTEGRPVTFKTYSEENILIYSVSFTYNSDQLICKEKDYEENGSTPDEDITVFNIENGFVVSGESDEGASSYLWEYDELGYKTKYTEQYSMGYVDEGGNITTFKETDITNYEWNNGVLIRANEYEENTLSRTYAYQYVTQTNKITTLDINAILCEEEYPEILGLTGQRTEQLLGQLVLSNDQWGKDNGTMDFHYEFDDAGYVTKVKGIWTSESATSEQESTLEILYE